MLHNYVGTISIDPFNSLSLSLSLSIVFIVKYKCIKYCIKFGWGMSGVRVNAEAGNSLNSFISKFRNANNAIWAIFCRSIGLKKFQNAVIQNNDIVHQL